jgi:hypothetical protein
MRADNTVHLIAAASRRHELAPSKAIRAVRELDAAGTAVTFESVARVAGVSRSWLYTQPDIRGEVLRLRDLGRRAPGTPVPARHRSSDASLLRRLEATTARNRELAQDNQRLRHQLARALGQLRAAGSRPDPSRLPGDRGRVQDEEQRSGEQPIMVSAMTGSVPIAPGNRDFHRAGICDTAGPGRSRSITPA